MINPNRPQPKDVAQQLLKERFSDARAVFLAGSVIRGEGTEHSDLDIVVVYEHLFAAARDSFYFQDWPVEVFVHDPETLRYFFYEMDAKSGIPALPNMVLEGVEITPPSSFSRSIKELAKSVIDAGPPILSEDEILRYRYAITDLCDDLRSPRSRIEALATGMKLYEALADFYFRSKSLWSAKGKTIPRRLAQVNSVFWNHYTSAFDSLFKSDETSSIIHISEEVLAPFGGFLFDGYKSNAPANWRKSEKPGDREFPILKSDRVIVRLAKKTDIPQIIHYFQNNQDHFASTDPSKPKEFYTESFWEERIRKSKEEFQTEQAIRFFIFDRDTNSEVIGTSNFSQLFKGPFQACYLGYGISHRHEGKGMMSEAIRLMVAYIFDDWNIHRIMANHLPDNERSARLLKKLGFLVEGQAKDYLFINGKWRDHVLNSLTNQKWKQNA